MATDLIRYDLLVQDALKGVVRKVLGDAVKDGLPGEHHFYVSFRTDHPGVRLSQRLRERYPQDMTIVLQHQFWDLGITEHAFEVGLSFSGIPERLLVPFDALTGFFDPSVQFGLKFELNEAADADAPSEPAPARPIRGAASEPAEAVPNRPAVPAAIAKPAASPKLPAKASGKGKAAAGPVEEEARPEAPAGDAGAEVVSLDAFRKKN